MFLAIIENFPIIGQENIKLCRKKAAYSLSACNGSGILVSMDDDMVFIGCAGT